MGLNATVAVRYLPTTPIVPCLAVVDRHSKRIRCVSSTLLAICFLVAMFGLIVQANYDLFFVLLAIFVWLLIALPWSLVTSRWGLTAFLFFSPFAALLVPVAFLTAALVGSLFGIELMPRRH